jgi:hypothetical protein
MIQRFLWRFIAADRQVLARCPVQDRYSFSLAGAVVMLVLGIIFTSMYLSGSVVFETRAGAAVSAFFWTLALGNLYMLNLITINSSGLPQRETKVSKTPAMAIRVLMVLLIAIVVSKLLEVHLFSTVSGDHLLAGLRGLSRSTWLFTVLNCIIFLTPVYLKAIGLTTTAYGSAQGEMEKIMVMESYVQFRMDYERMMMDSTGLAIPYRERYTDPPFNTQRIPDTRTIQGKGKLIEFLKKEKEKTDVPPPDDPTRP